MYALDAVCGGAAASCTPTVKFAVPAVVGVPVIAPVELFSVRPAGNDPAVIDHVYGVVPPVACNALRIRRPTPFRRAEEL